MNRGKFLILVILLDLYATASAARHDIYDSSNHPVFQFEPALTTAESMPRLYSLLVSWRGHLVLEHYYNGSGPLKLINIKSASKSVLSSLIGIAINRGYIKGLDQPISEYFSNQIINSSGFDKGKITIADLISMQSGLETTSNRNYGAWVLSKDWVAFALNQPMESNPGIYMRYSTGNTHLLSAILTQASGKTTLQFAREHLAQPLGFLLAEWPRDPAGIYFGGNDMEMTARQMIAFGELYLNDGIMNGKQIISADWIKVSLQRHAKSTREEGRYYGYGWWLREMAGFETAYAWGYGGQFIILVPDLDLVIVTTSSSMPHRDRRTHRRELRELLEIDIIKPVAERLKTKSVSMNE